MMTVFKNLGIFLSISAADVFLWEIVYSILSIYSKRLILCLFVQYHYISVTRFEN